MTIEAKQFNLLAILTGIIVLGYFGAATYAFTTGIITWQMFSGAVGPIAGALSGYWLRGIQQ